MNDVVGKASQGEARASEDGFDLVRGREAADSVENVGGFFSRKHFFVVLSVSDGDLTSLVGRTDANLSKPRWTCAMSGADNLLRLALAAVWSSPQRPRIARADCVHRIPKLRGNAGIRRIF